MWAHASKTRVDGSKFIVFDVLLLPATQMRSDSVAMATDCVCDANQQCHKVLMQPGVDAGLGRQGVIDML